MRPLSASGNGTRGRKMARTDMPGSKQNTERAFHRSRHLPWLVLLSLTPAWAAADKLVVEDVTKHRAAVAAATPQAAAFERAKAAPGPDALAAFVRETRATASLPADVREH